VLDVQAAQGEWVLPGSQEDAVWSVGALSRSGEVALTQRLHDTALFRRDGQIYEYGS
jgi:hypothetical protein